jgi:poly(3-hydroxybutyrate) depolymerase
VLVLYGEGGDGRTLRHTYGWKPMVERGELVAVYPDAVCPTRPGRASSLLSWAIWHG